VNTQLKRTPKDPPKLLIHKKPKSIFDYTYEDFELVEYKHDDPIKAPVAI
jgi:thymidylate synthase